MNMDEIRNIRPLRESKPDVDPEFVLGIERLLDQAKRGEIVGLAAAIENKGSMWTALYLGTGRSSPREFAAWISHMWFDLMQYIHTHDNNKRT